MATPLSGPGVGLPLPTFLYPSELQNAPYDYGTNRVALAPGQEIPIPAGDWYISMGGYLVIQYYDPVSNTWVFGSGSAWNRGVNFVKSDGFNVRLANLTGCPVGAVITSGGSGYVQASTTISVTGGGGSTWAPIIGGALQASVLSVGAGYGVAPIGIIPNPPPPQTNANGIGGIAASGWAAISSGTVPATGFTMTNSGAGYPSAPPNIALLPNPTDPNLNTGITLGTVGFSITYTGTLTGVLLTNPGAPLALPASITLAVSGVGSTATVTAVYMQTVTAATVSGAGVGYGTAAGAVLTVGGAPGTDQIATTPNSLYLSWFPRPAQISLTPANTSVSVGSPGVVIDGGLFVSGAAPSALWLAQLAGSAALGTVGTVALSVGSTKDIAILQPAP
jgi:hypothetical protein